MRMGMTHTSTINILLVEDTTDDAALLAHAPGRVGEPRFSVTRVARLDQALDLLPGSFDVVLLDLLLPDSQRLEAFTSIYGRFPWMPIVLLSGVDNENLAVEAVGLGAQDYLVKASVDHNTLARSIHYAIERKRVENENARLLAQVERQRERLDRIIATVPGVMWEAWGQPDHEEQHIDFVSVYVETMLGYTVEEWLSTPNFWLTIVHPDDREKAARVAAEQFASGEGGINRFRWVAKDGRVIWCEAQATVIKDPQGNPVGMRGVTLDVSDRVRLEEEVHRHAEVALVEHERLATLIANVNIGLAMTDAQSRLVVVNDTWLRRRGLRREDVIGRRYADLGSNHVMDVSQSVVDQVLSEGEPVVIRELYLPADPERFPNGLYIDWSLQPLREADGRITGLLAVSVDVTEKVHARQQVENQRILLETAIASIPVGIVYFDRDMRVLNVNAAWEAMAGLKAADALGRTIYDLFPNAETRRPVYERALSGEPIDEENRLIPSRGTDELRYYDVRYRPLRDADGSIIGIISTVTDVHDKFQATQELQAQKTLLDTIFQSAPIGLALFDVEMRYLNVNAEYARLSRHKIEALKGRIMYEVEPSALARKPVHDRVLAGESVDDENVAYTHAGGEVKYYSLLYRPVRDASGFIIGVLSAVVDVTERQQLDQQKDEFIALASHELKTPVTAIKGNAQVATRLVNSSGADSQNEKLLRVLNTINSQSDRLTRLIDDLLDISRVDTSTLALYKEEFDLGKLVRETVEGVEIAAHGFEFSLDIADEPCIVEADRHRIEQVIMNLLQNAVKYASDQRRVDVSVSRDGDEAVVAVRDFGVGIPADEQGQVFGRFFRARNVSARRYSGLGLGLFIAHGIVARHGGRMWLQSVEGHGSTFYFALPRT